MSVSFSTAIQKAKTSPTHQTTALLREALSKLPVTTYSTLGNGFKVACEENPHAQFATVGIWMDTGAKYEIRGKNRAAAKLLELCGLQGTTNQNRSQIAKAIDEIGGHLHCETGVEQSKIYVKCHKDQVPKAVSLMSDIIQNARLADEDLEAAKLELDAQRDAKEEDPQAVTMENLRMIAYDSVDGLGNTVCALKTESAQVTAQTLADYRKAHYSAPRMVLVGAGAVNHTQMEKLAQDNFGSMQSTAKPVIETRYVGGDVKLWNLRTTMTHFAWAFETCGAKSGDQTALNLVKHMFGNFHRSQHELAQHATYRMMKMYNQVDLGCPNQTPMNQKAIEQAHFFNNSYADSGLAGHFVTTRCEVSDPGHSAMTHYEHMQWTFLETNRISQRSMTAEELEYGKVNYKSQMLFNCDGSTNTAEDIGRQVLQIGRRVSVDEMFNRIDDTTRTNVMESMQHYYTHRRPVVSWHGCLPYTPAYTDIQNWTGKFLSAY
eukprot:152536_1